jgi:hypothetical protein
MSDRPRTKCDKRPKYGMQEPHAGARRRRALRPVTDNHEIGGASFEFRKLVDSGTFRLRNVFRALFCANGTCVVDRGSCAQQLDG